MIKKIMLNKKFYTQTLFVLSLVLFGLIENCLGASAADPFLKFNGNLRNILIVIGLSLAGTGLVIVILTAFLGRVRWNWAGYCVGGALALIGIAEILAY